MNLKNRGGSVAVLVMLLLTTLVAMIMTFVAGAREEAVKSTSHALGNLWAKSVMAEYDIHLKDRYGIFGFQGVPKEVNRKINFLANQSFEGKSYISYEGCETRLFAFSLASTRVMKEQIIEVGKLSAAKKLIEPGRKKDGVKNKSGKSSKSNTIETAAGGLMPESQICIGNDRILDKFPSNGTSWSISIDGIAEKFKKFNSIKDVFKQGTDEFFEQQYIFNYFKDGMNARGIGKTLFNYEIEYIISGKMSDFKNQRALKLKLIAIREALNFAYACKDPKMQAEALAAAEVLTPGPLAVATKYGLLATWALAESYNDYQLLVHGKKVPLMKTPDTWAIDIQSILSGGKTNYVDTHSKEGEVYEDYLKALIYLMDEDVRVLRTMDLIQMNMMYCYYKNFRLADYSGGIELHLKVNGENYETKKKY